MAQATRKPAGSSAVPSVRINVLDQEGIERIHELTLAVLEDSGIILHYPPARELLRFHGATVDEVSQVARIPRRLVQQALQSAPRAVTMYGQADPARDCYLALDGGHYARSSTGLNWILDYRDKVRRPVTADDAENWARVAQALPNIHFVGSLLDQEPGAHAMEVRSLSRLMRHTDKPLVFSALSGEGMRWLHRLIEVVQPPGRGTRLMVLSSVNSPLIYGWGQCEAAMVSAELDIPVLFNSSAVAGVTGPATLAGNIIEMNAEMLAALTIIQLHRPGAPAIYSAHPMVFDMRTGMSSISVVEVGLMSAACVQIGRHYGLPTASNGVATDSCCADGMAVMEKWASSYLPAMALANVNAGAGSLECVGTVSLEQLVIDDDIYGNIFRSMRGINMDDESLAADVIKKVGPGGSYLAEPHTLRHCRSEYYYSPLATRMTSAAWEAEGSREVLDRAHDRVRRILAGEPKQFLSVEQAREVDRLTARAEAALANIEVPI